MIELLIQSYLSLLLSVGGGAVFVFLVGLYWILKPKRPARVSNQSSSDTLHQALHAVHSASIQSNDHQTKQHDVQHDHIAAIAGDDVMATQLDLARAYIETGKKQSAKNILDHVIAKGNATQQVEAKHLQQRL